MLGRFNVRSLALPTNYFTRRETVPTGTVPGNYMCKSQFQFHEVVMCATTTFVAPKSVSFLLNTKKCACVLTSEYVRMSDDEMRK